MIGVSMVISAWGEGVLLCPPSSSSDRASPAQSACKNYAEDWIFKEYIFYVVGARVMDVSMVIEA